MRRIFTLIGLVSLFISAHAQDFVWAKAGGLWAYDYGYGICTDAQGNVYVAGKYEMDARFDNVTVTCAGNHDAFVAKFNPQGEMQWIRTAGGPGGDYARAIACDAAGNVYVAGEIDGDAMFGSLQVTGHAGADDAFVAKYSTNGDLIWAKGYGGYNREDARGIAVDATGNIYITGVYRGVAYFGSYTLNGTDIDDVFVARLDQQGNVSWVLGMGGPEDEACRGIAVDKAGNIYITGGFKGTAHFGATMLETKTAGYRDTYVAKLNAGGAVVWAKSAGGEWDDVGWSIAADETDVYVTGEFVQMAQFSPLLVTGQGNGDVFVAKYSANSGNTLWVKCFGGANEDRGRGIATDGSNVYITGQYAGTVTHGQHTLASADHSDIFAASFSSSTGEAGWAVSVKGAAEPIDDMGFESGTSIAVHNGYPYVTGAYLGGETFGWIYLEPWTRTDMFIGMIDPQAPQSVKNIADAGHMQLHPNPASGPVRLELESGEYGRHDLEIVNARGEKVVEETLGSFSGSFSKQIDLTPFGAGIYLLRVSSPAGSTVKKIVID